MSTQNQEPGFSTRLIVFAIIGFVLSGVAYNVWRVIDSLLHATGVMAVRGVTANLIGAIVIPYIICVVCGFSHILSGLEPQVTRWVQRLVGSRAMLFLELLMAVYVVLGSCALFVMALLTVIG